MRVKTADRTCNLILGVGDGKAKKMNSIRYSYSAADFFDDKTLEPGPYCTQAFFTYEKKFLSLKY